MLKWHTEIWQAISRAPLDKHSPMRSASLASTGPSGTPQARIVVLREVQTAAQRLSFFTDSRSPKVTELAAQAQVQWLLWHPAHQLQLRLSAKAWQETDESVLKAAWARVSQSPAAGDYLSFQAPGEALDASKAASQRTDAAFCIMHTQVLTIDALKLSREGHRRARFAYSNNTLSSAEYIQS